MAELLIGVVLLLLLLRVLGNGEAVELEDVLGIPQVLATLLLAALMAILFLERSTAEAGRPPALAMLGIAASGLLMILFPERMPDTTRGGTLMTAFWSLFGWLMIGLACAVVLIA